MVQGEVGGPLQSLVAPGKLVVQGEVGGLQECSPLSREVLVGNDVGVRDLTHSKFEIR